MDRCFHKKINPCQSLIKYTVCKYVTPKQPRLHDVIQGVAGKLAVNPLGIKVESQAGCCSLA